MKKIDAQKLSRDALKALRSQAMRLRQELALPWREIARFMGLHVTTVFGWAQRYAAEGEAGLVSKKPRRAYLSGRTLKSPQKVCLVLDNLSAHQAKEVAAWVEAHENKIEVFYLIPLYTSRRMTALS